MKRSTINGFVILLLFCTAGTDVTAQPMEQQLEAAVQAYFDARQFTGSVLVAKGEAVLFEKGFGEANRTWSIQNAPDVRYRIGSITKQFTAAVILKMASAGAIELQSTIRDYIPYYPEPQGSKVTIHQLLNHTSGIPSYTSLPEFGTELMKKHMEHDSMLAQIWNRELEFEPGSQFRYNNSGYFILGVIIERAASMSYEKALQTYLFDPLGLENTGYEHNNVVIPRLAEGYSRTPIGWDRAQYLDTGGPFAAGMLYSTVGDLHQWTLALHRGQVFQDAEMYTKMTTPYLDNYGYGLGIREFKAGDRQVKAILHSGGINGFSSQCWYLPEEEYTIVVLDNGQGPSERVANAIFRVLHNLPLDAPKPSIADEVARVRMSSNMDDAIERYEELKSNSFDAWDFSENELNRLGYWYLGRGETADALAVFALNIEAYSDASNPYDSMGEALHKAGRYEESIEMYQKALELNPGSQTALAMLRKMGVVVETEGIELSEDLLESYVGKFELQPGFILTFTRDGQQMYAQATGQQRFEIYPSSENEFYLKVVEASVTFHHEADGSVERVTLHQGGRDMEAKRIE